MMDISQIRPYVDELQFAGLPAARIIGIEARNGGKLGNTAVAMWDHFYATDQHTILEGLAQLVSKDMYGWTSEYDPETGTFTYMVCALTPAGTPVPEGFTCRDIPPAQCVIGLYGETVEDTLKRAKAAGYTDDWNAPGMGWNAEVYFHVEEEDPPRHAKTPWHWMIPIRKV